MKSGIIKTRSFPIPLRIQGGRIFVDLETKKFLAYVLFVICFLAGLLFYLWPHLQLLQSGFQHSSLLTQKERLMEENKALRLEVSSLESLDRVERIARGELGMTAPEKGQLIYVKLQKAPER